MNDPLTSSPLCWSIASVNSNWIEVNICLYATRTWWKFGTTSPCLLRTPVLHKLVWFQPAHNENKDLKIIIFTLTVIIHPISMTVSDWLIDWLTGHINLQHLNVIQFAHLLSWLWAIWIYSNRSYIMPSLWSMKTTVALSQKGLC